jgi:hypothetical protein
VRCERRFTMFRPIASVRTAAAILAVCLISMVACDRHQSVDVTAPAPEPVPDIVEDHGDTAGYAYLPGNTYHDRRMEELMRRPDVSAVVGAFAGDGLHPSPDKSITVRGSDGDNSVWATLITFDGGERSAIIACYGSGDRFGISPVQFSLNKPSGEAGWQPFVGNGWYAVPEVGDFPRAPQRFEPFEWWDWGFFGRCMADQAPAVAASCGFQCFWVPGYWQCFMVCTAAEAVGATIKCILRMYRWGGDEFTKEQ